MGPALHIFPAHKACWHRPSSVLRGSVTTCIENIAFAQQRHRTGSAAAVAALRALGGGPSAQSFGFASRELDAGASQGSSMADNAGTLTSAEDLVYEVDAAVKAAATGEVGRACDSLERLATKDVTAQLLLGTGGGKKVRA